MTRPSTMSRKSRFLGAASGLCLILASPGHAQPPIRSDKPVELTRGKRIDHSRVRTLPVAPNTEREDRSFDPLGGSTIVYQEQRIVLTDRPPQPVQAVRVTQEGVLDGTNFESGSAVLAQKARETLTALAERLKGKSALKVEVLGHTDNQRIAKRLLPTYPTNQVLSEARAQAVIDFLRTVMALSPDQVSASGLGDTQPVGDNATPSGMAANRRTVIRATYEQAAAAAPPPPLLPKIATSTLEQVDDCRPTLGPSKLPFSISIDGRPLDADSVQTEADRQRCVDVALDRADIQIKFDPLNVAPALNVWSVPGVSGRSRSVLWRTYTNYAWWLRKAEIRVFTRGQQTSESPFAVVPVSIGGDAKWTIPTEASSELGYVLRVYDETGLFDETAVKTLDLLDLVDPAQEADRVQRDNLSGYGQSSRKLANIPAAGGSVTISGENIAAGETVSALGIDVPVDRNGKFVVRQILPAGPQKVAVAVKQANGRVATFERNLNIADKDWFYVAVADLTASDGRTTGPAQIVTGDTDHYDKSTSFDGRLAFYLKGKILGKYLLTASADTREQPLENLFSNFDSKDPSYLLRRIDPDRYYPVYGDDSTAVDDAPTQGKFYVRIERDNASVMWGSFQTSWTGTELTQYSRGLYGADVIWNSKAATSQGERRTTVEAFAAEPGTLQSREEFRGTGGSQFYLRRQDVTQGSERLWAEVRDRDSGIVLQRTLLAPSQDYDINYLQGRLTLRSPLPIVADGSGLVQTSSLDGNPVYLVATYEYVPGLSRVQGSTLGVRASHWVTGGFRIGGTVYHQGDGGSDQDLRGLDFTLRYKPGTWLKGEFAQSEGIGDGDLTSLTGGFDFTQNQTTDAKADAHRFDVAVDLSDLNETIKGRLTGYVQNRERGFSAPGLVTPGGESLRQAGFAAVVPVADRAEVAVKVDDRDSTSQSANSQEIAVRYKLNAEWGISAGLRRDDRQTATGPGALFTASPLLALDGERTDGILRFDFRPLQPGQARAAAGEVVNPGPVPGYAQATEGSTITADSAGPAGSLIPSAIAGTPGAVQTIGDPTLQAGIAAARVAGLAYKPWNLYGFGQQTFSHSGARQTNDRAGLGGSWQVTDRLRLGAEGSAGDGGLGGKVSGDYSLDDRSNLYLTYARETEVPDQTYAGRQGVLTFGGRMRLNDQLGVFAESRAASGEGPRSLTNGFGVDFAPAKHWTTGLRFDTGRLSDRVSGDLKRDAISVNVGYRDDKLKVLSAVEYRNDRSNSLGSVTGVCTTDSTPGAAPCISTGGATQRETVLLKNSVTFQLDPSWRLLGVANLSRSTSSQGEFYDGDYTEAVLGAAYRPIDNDRWNALLKYTYFANLPSSGQIGPFTNSVLDYSQRSHVLNLDAIYDLTPWLSIGGKYGLRVGELRASRTSGEWFSSRAQLFVARADVHFVKEWDAVLEWRLLDVKAADDSRMGALIGVYRHIGEHGKIGVGYNFTDFSDDLTDQSYRSRGFFINAIATF